MIVYLSRECSNYVGRNIGTDLRTTIQLLTAGIGGQEDMIIDLALDLIRDRLGRSKSARRMSNEAQIR